ncbi:ankyrin repeat protein [Chrysochromulina tobinii]|uniref:Ankyrin repeat protein n=1 Tax=Chrysochromulina tobinii TaxID=1460289 RepID=A0A0M0JKI2_9EUKA|nr:ankyrin repeat protein [Chrysochromulina tobinii]|eukprot:KOO27079.1 ankyrin repeat protein [Chrysochromulina sp. CCMP291]
MFGLLGGESNATNILFNIARRGDVMEMVVLLRRFPTCWETRDSEGCTALHAAASAGAMDMGQLLMRAGAGARDADKDGWEALHYACANGHYGMAAWLLQSGADLSARTNEGWQPLHVAAHTGQTQLARYLSSHGADLRAKTKSGQEAVHLATDAAARDMRAVDFVQWLLRFYLGLSTVLRRTEHKAAQTIQRHYRFQRRLLATHASMVGGAVGQAQASARLARAVLAQAARCVDTTLSRALLIKHLKLDLATLMEKGRVYTPPGMSVQLVAWRLRFFFCNDFGLCYQKVANNLRPCGVKRLIPWAALRRVEALQDDSIFIETTTLKKYYLKPKGAPNPALFAWTAVGR